MPRRPRSYAKNRQIAQMRVGQERRLVEGGYCVYCGEPSQCLDHVPPVSVTKKGVVLPSCNECNHIAGAKYPFDFKGRLDHVRGKLYERYQRSMETPDWADDELDGLGHTLRTGVEAWQNLKERTKQRLAWNAAKYLRRIDPMASSVLMHAGCDIISAIEREPLWSSADW